MDTIKSGANHAVLHAKTTDEGGVPKRHAILVLKSLFRMQKKTHMCGLGTIETCKSSPKVAVLHAKATNEG